MAEDAELQQRMEQAIGLGLAAKVEMFKIDLHHVLGILASESGGPRCKGCNNMLTLAGPVWHRAEWYCFLPTCSEWNKPQEATL